MKVFEFDYEVGDNHPSREYSTFTFKPVASGVVTVTQAEIDDYQGLYADFAPAVKASHIAIAKVRQIAADNGATAACVGPDYRSKEC